MPEPLIELKGVSKKFGNNVILDRVDRTVYREDHRRERKKRRFRGRFS